MKQFKSFLAERFGKPPEIDEFKKSVSHIDKVDSRDDSWQHGITDFMKHYGFTLSGSGKYASVYVNPKYNYAIKVFMRDTAYLKFLQWALAHQHNPYLPRFRGKVIKLNDIFYAVRIEKLTPADDRIASEMNELLRDAEDVLDGLYDDSTYTLKTSDPHIQEICKFLAANSKLVDIHLGNIMQRGSTPVLVDPLYNWFKGGRYTIDPDDISGLKDLF